MELSPIYTNLISIILIYSTCLIIGELFFHFGLHTFYTRKLVHILGGIATALMPLFIELEYFIILSIFLILILQWTCKQKYFKSLHLNCSKDNGVIFFPLGMIITAILFWRIDTIIFQASALILGISDPIASLGSKFKKNISYNISGKKTLAGSLLFFTSTLIILLLFTHFYGISSISTLTYIIIGSLVLTIIEGLLGKGYDNLLITPIAGTIVYFLLQL